MPARHLQRAPPPPHQSPGLPEPRLLVLFQSSANVREGGGSRLGGATQYQLLGSRPRLGIELGSRAGVRCATSARVGFESWLIRIAHYKFSACEQRSGHHLPCICPLASRHRHSRALQSAFSSCAKGAPSPTSRLGRLDIQNLKRTGTIARETWCWLLRAIASAARLRVRCTVTCRWCPGAAGSEASLPARFSVLRPRRRVVSSRPCLRT